MGRGKRPGENDASLPLLRDWLLKRGVPSFDIIVDTKSMNTYDQAVNTLALCHKKKWKQLLLVTSPYHQVRAFLTFLRTSKQYKFQFRFINQPALYLKLDKNPSGRDKTARQVLSEERVKIKKYDDQIASLEEGIDYLTRTHLN